MAVAELSSPACAKTTRLPVSQLSLSPTRFSDYCRRSFRPIPRTRNAQISCSVASNEVQAPVALQEEDIKIKKDCYGVFCLTYDLKSEEETKSWKKCINIAVSGAAGMISNHLLFKLAAGEVFGPEQPIALKLLGSERSLQALEGVAMELEDSLFPLLREVRIGINPYEVFQDAEWALLIGAKPRGPGMERAALLDINGQIFAEQGKALNAVASRNVKVLVVGNPCNTNALICLKNAPNIPAKNFHALTRLDENRAKCQLALKAGVFYDKVSNMTIWVCSKTLSTTLAQSTVQEVQPIMGLLSWFRGSPKPSQPESSKPTKQKPQAETPVPGMNGAVEVPRPESVTVFEFGSVAATGDKVTLAGFCPVSDELEPCRWEILPASGSDAPQFRVVF